MASNLPPSELLQGLHKIELEFGRQRNVRNEARVLDLDLIDYNGVVLEEAHISLPHPRMHSRGFVLYPLAEIAPDWAHPTLGTSVSELIANLPDEGPVTPVAHCE